MRRRHHGRKVFSNPRLCLAAGKAVRQRLGSAQWLLAIVGGVGDTHNNAFYDPRAGKYVLITRYLGFLMLINTGGDKSVDCELTWSPDTVTWHRVNPGTPLIPRGPKGSYDAGCIYGPAGGPILRDGKLGMLYGGREAFHIGTKRHCLPCWAFLRPDGSAGYAPAQPGRCVENNASGVRRSSRNRRGGFCCSQGAKKR